MAMGWGPTAVGALMVLTLAGCVSASTATPTESAGSTKPTVTASGSPGVTQSPPGSSPLETPSPSASPPGARVNVLLQGVRWDLQGGRVQAAGMITGVIEAGGSCTLSLTSPGTTITSVVGTEPGATVTYCDPFSVRNPQITAGQWTARLTYTSPTSHGVSTTQTFQVS